MCTLFLLYKYARCESQQKKIGHVWIFKVLCDLCTRECGVVFVANSLCTWVINSRPLTHVNLNPNKECTPSPENNYDLSNIQDTPINLHTWLIKQITLHIIGGGGEEFGLSRLLQEPSHESLSERSTPKHPPNSTIGTPHYKPMPNSMKLCLIPTKMKITGGESRLATCCRCGRFGD